MFAPYVDSLWVAVGLISIAAAAHQGWSANLFTFSSDMFPRRAVGSVVGIRRHGRRDRGHAVHQDHRLHPAVEPSSYLPVFIMAGFAYLTALGVSTCSCR